VGVTEIKSDNSSILSAEADKLLPPTLTPITHPLPSAGWTYKPPISVH